MPTAHDEPAIRLGIYRDVFSSAAGIVWNTDVERRFVTSMFHLRALVEDVVGCGVDLPEGDDSPRTDEPRGRRATTGIGREPLRAAHRGPGQRVPPPASHPRPVPALRRPHRSRARAARSCSSTSRPTSKEGGDATLMLMGAKLMPLPDDPRVRFAGMLPDEERLHALEAATVVVVPSPYESLSLLALEAFAVGTPVLANAARRCSSSTAAAATPGSTTPTAGSSSRR